MPPQAQTIKLTRTINAPPSEVYYAFTAAAAWRQWCEADAQTDPRPGGRLYVYTPGYAAVGEFTALEQDKSVAFSWDGQREPPTQVHIALQAQGGGTRTHFNQIRAAIQAAGQQ